MEKKLAGLNNRNTNVKIKVKSPVLFGLPPNDFEAEMEKKRNKKLFLKMKEAKKKLQSVNADI